jgi:hypothetical protein
MKMSFHYARNGLLTLICCVGPAVAGQGGTVTSPHRADLAQPSASYAAAASEQKLTINSTYGALLDNPITKAVLLKLARRGSQQSAIADGARVGVQRLGAV